MGTLTTAVQQAHEREVELQKRRREVDATLTDARRTLAASERRGSKTVEANRQRVSILEDLLTEVSTDLEEAMRAVRQAQLALHEVHEARWAERLEAVRQELGVSPQGDVQITGDAGEWTRWRCGQWEVQLVEIDPATGRQAMKTHTTREGQQVELPAVRFGFAVTVYGPGRVEQFVGLNDEPRVQWKPAQVNWGSLGSLSTDQARDMVRVHLLGIQMAEYINAHLDQWYAEDQAD